MYLYVSNFRSEPGLVAFVCTYGECLALALELIAVSFLGELLWHSATIAKSEVHYKIQNDINALQA
jgi:hypothetical protein